SCYEGWCITKLVDFEHSGLQADRACTTARVPLTLHSVPCWRIRLHSTAKSTKDFTPTKYAPLSPASRPTRSSDIATERSSRSMGAQTIAAREVRAFRRWRTKFDEAL